MPGCSDSFSVFLPGACPCFHPILASFLCWSLCRSSLFIHAGLLAFLSEFLFVGLLHSWPPPKKVILDYLPAFLSPSSLQAFIPWYSTKQIPEQAKVCSPEVRSSELAAHLHCPKDNELHHFMVTAARLPLSFTFPTSSSLLVRTRSSIEPLIAGSSVTWRRKLSPMHSRNLFDYLCHAVLSCQQISGWLKFPMRSRACECEAAPICLERASSP